MVEAGECCGFIPYYYIKNQVPKGVKVYSLPEPLSWDITASYKKALIVTYSILLHDPEH